MSSGVRPSLCDIRKLLDCALYPALPLSSGLCAAYYPSSDLANTGSASPEGAVCVGDSMPERIYTEEMVGLESFLGRRRWTDG